MKEILAKNKVLVGLGVAAGLLVIITSVGSQDQTLDDAVQTAATSPAAQQSTTSTVVPGPQPDSDITALDCHTLLTSEETGDALNAFELSASSLSVSENEVCREYFVDDDRYFVIIQPGTPTDFDAGTQLLDVSGQSVPDVGDAARWFSANRTDPETLVGVLAVGKNTPHGGLHFRIVIGRPDVDEATLQDIAVGLANAALPRFPGVEVEPPEPPEPVVVAFEEESPDLSDLSLVDNLLAREEAGDWTRGEGLVATLRLLGGDASHEDVLVNGEVLHPDGSGVIAMARSFIEQPSEHAEEIEQLLDDLLFTRAELDAVPLEDDVSGLIADGLFVSASILAQEEACDPESESCLLGSYLPPAEGVPDGKYRLFRYSGDAGWTGTHYQALVDGVTKSAQAFEDLATMPSTDVILGVTPGKGYLATVEQGHCVVKIPTGYQSDDPGDFRQNVARFLAHCFVHGTLPSANAAEYPAQRWWVDGLIIYLSGVVFPDNNLEHDTLPAKLAQQELADPIPARSFTNWIVFEYLHSVVGVNGVLALMGSLPSGGSGVPEFAAADGMDALVHDLGRGLSDANVADLGTDPTLIPYSPVAWELEISGPTEFTVPVPQLGIRRLHITVPDDQYACTFYVQSGNQEVSWREGGPGEQNHDWVDGTVDPLQGEMVMVITSVDEGAEFTMEVEDLSEDPECEEEDESQPTEPECAGTDIICRASRFYYKNIVGED